MKSKVVPSTRCATSKGTTSSRRWAACKNASANLERLLQLGAHEIPRTEAIQHREEVRRLSHLLAEFPRPSVDTFHFWSCPALGRHQRRAEGVWRVELVLGTLGGIREGAQELQPLSEVRDCFHIGRALAGPLARPLPVGDGLFREARLGIVMRQELGLGLAVSGNRSANTCAIR